MNTVMIEEIKKELESRLPKGTHIKDNKIIKNNGLELQGVCVTLPGEIIGTTVYIDSMLEEVENGEKTVADLADYIAETAKENVPTDDMKSFKFSKESILANVQYQIINKEANSKMLEDAVYKEFLDLAIIYRVMVGYNGSFVVKNSLIERYDISIEELDEAARENTQNVGFVVKDMRTAMEELFEFCDEPADLLGDETMYVMTNRTHFNGAAIMIYPKYFEKLANIVNDDLYILPASIHEVLAIPDRFAGDARNLKETVREVNDTEVEEVERLSYNVYKYSRETGEFSVA